MKILGMHRSIYVISANRQYVLQACVMAHMFQLEASQQHQRVPCCTKLSICTMRSLVAAVRSLAVTFAPLRHPKA
jgi:hypothetical protein